MDKKEREQIFYNACDNCHLKTIKEMQKLHRTEQTEQARFYNSVIAELIEQRKMELNFNDGSGRLYW